MPSSCGAVAPPPQLDAFSFRSTLRVRPGIVNIGSVPWPRWPADIARQVAADVRYALTFKVGRSRRPLTDAERDLVAAAVVEHLQLTNWEIRKGPPAQDGRAYDR
jgi:hypothetical protein